MIKPLLFSAAIGLSSLTFTGCATVNMGGSDTISLGSSELSDASSDLKRNARRLSKDFYKNGWTDYNPDNKLGAAISFLKDGWSGDDEAVDPVQAYMENTPTRDSYISDVAVATAAIEGVTADAALFLDLYDGDKKLSSELTAVEDALMSAVTAKSLFKQVADNRDYNAALAMTELEAAINDLSAVADSMGVIARGAANETPAS